MLAALDFPLCPYKSWEFFGLYDAPDYSKYIRDYSRVLQEKKEFLGERSDSGGRIEAGFDDYIKALFDERWTMQKSSAAAAKVCRRTYLHIKREQFWSHRLRETLDSDWIQASLFS